MPFITPLLTQQYFPSKEKDMPFGEMLNSLYFSPNPTTRTFLFTARIPVISRRSHAR